MFSSHFLIQLKFAILLLLLFYISLCYQNCLVVEPKIHPNWTSLTFLVAIVPPRDPIPYNWENCVKFSSFYCLDAYETSTERSERALDYYSNGMTYFGISTSQYWLRRQAYIRYSFKIES